MSQALSIPPATAGAVAVTAGGAEAPQTSDSGPSFGETLAGQLAGGEAAVETAAEPAASYPDGDADVTTDILAAPGNPLPPVLPPTMFVAPPADAIGATTTASDTPTDGPLAASLAGSGALAVQPSAAEIAPEARATDGRAFSLTPIAAKADARPVSPRDPVAASDTNAVAPWSDTNATKLPAMQDPDVRRDAGISVGTEPIAGSTSAPTTTPVAIAPLLAPASVPTDSTSVAAAPVPTPGHGQVAVPFGQSAWGQSFGSQVVWAVGQNMPSAELHLSPPELGPVSVRISMDQDQASISFASPHAAVREAIEAALPRLRDMLGTQGIVLADANVAQHGHSHQAWQDSEGRATRGTAADRDPDRDREPALALRIPAAGVLDLYA